MTNLICNTLYIYVISDLDFIQNSTADLVVAMKSLVVGHWFLHSWCLVVSCCCWSLVIGRWSLVVVRWWLFVDRCLWVLGCWLLIVDCWLLLLVVVCCSLVIGRWLLIVGAHWSLVAGRSFNVPRCSLLVCLWSMDKFILQYTM